MPIADENGILNNNTGELFKMTFNDTYNASPNHKYATIGYTTINGYKREVLKDKDGYNQFVQEIRNHFLNTSSSYQMVVNRPSNSLS